jgi:hypothetical protein
MGLGRNQRRAQNYRDTRGNHTGENDSNIGISPEDRRRKSNKIANKILNYDDIIRGMGYKKDGVNKRRGGCGQEDMNGDDNGEMTEAVLHQLDVARAKEESTYLGDMTRSRPDQVFRLMAGNVNNMANNIVRRGKICEIQYIVDQWDIQAIGLSEVGIDFRKVHPNKNISSWFRANREKYRTSIAHNTEDPTISISQPGGIALIACKELKQYIQDSRGDFRKLGRWISWIIGTTPDHIDKQECP